MRQDLSTILLCTRGGVGNVRRLRNWHEHSYSFCEMQAYLPVTSVSWWAVEIISLATRFRLQVEQVCAFSITFLFVRDRMAANHDLFLDVSLGLAQNGSLRDS